MKTKSEIRVEVNKELFDNFLKDNKISKSKLCKLAKFSLDTYEKVVSGRCNYRINVLFKLARVMKVQVYQMFK